MLLQELKAWFRKVKKIAKRQENKGKVRIPKEIKPF